MRRSYTPKIIASAVGTLILLAPIVAAFAVMLRRAVGDEQPRLIKALVWLSCLAPMALVVVGHDVARWMAAGFTSAGLLILALRRRRDEPANEASATWFWPVFCFSLINGPLHAVVGTSLLEHLADVAGFKR